MSPTLNPHLPFSILIIDKVTPALGWYKPVKGDVVEYTKPGSYSRVVKRVVGVYGDAVRPRQGPNEFLQLREDMFWAEGDNCVTSLDSNDYGPVEVRSIVGKCLYSLSLFSVKSLERKDTAGERVMSGDLFT